MRLGDKYTDFTICVGDRNFRCHRVILAAVSEMFESMFDIEGFMESKTGETNLDEFGLDEKTCSDLLEFIYTGSQGIVTIDNADILLHVAHMIQIRSLHTLCKEYLKMNANKFNCVRVWQISQRHAETEDLAELSRSLILKHFAEIAQGEEKLDHLENMESLLRILKAENINAVDKSGLFTTVAVSWVVADFENRYQYFPRLCDALLENGVLPGDIFDEAMGKVEFNGNHCNTAIRQTLERLSMQNREVPGSFSAPVDEVLVIMGGSDGGNNSSVMCFSFPQKTWFSLKPIPKDPGYNFALCSRGLDFFVSGGSGYGPSRFGFHSSGGGATFFQYNGESNDWIELADMPTGRQYHAMYAVGTYVYVLGGTEGNSDSCSNVVHKYNCNNNSWTKSKTNIYEAVRSAAHACIGKKIYLLGGFQTNQSQTNTIQYFDCEFEQSVRVHYSIPDFARLNSKAVNFNGNLLLICKNGKVLRCSEKSETKEIAAIQDFGRKGFGACSFEDKILICGGEVDFIPRKDMLLCDIMTGKVKAISMQETVPISVQNFCYTKGRVLREHLSTECGTSMSAM